MVLGPGIRNRGPLWFDDENEERILSRAREWLESIRNDVTALFEESPHQDKDAAIKSALNLLDRADIKNKRRSRKAPSSIHAICLRCFFSGPPLPNPARHIRPPPRRRKGPNGESSGGRNTLPIRGKKKGLGNTA